MAERRDNGLDVRNGVAYGGAPVLSAHPIRRRASTDRSGVRTPGLVVRDDEPDALPPPGRAAAGA